jgi:tripartite-type tricarboxylate transporter receptor subunit TctC
MVTMFSESANSSRYRYVATKLGEQLGVSIIIDAKPGGGGVIALRDVYRAQPMGYSLLLANNNLVGNSFAYKNPGYRIDDYTPVGVMGLSPYALIMNADAVPASNLAEFVAWAKANPGKVNYGSLGPAAGSNISAERFKLMAGISMTGVPYKGGDQMAQGMLAGDIHITWISLNSARVRMQNKQIIGLATTGEERSALLPNIPTFRESGYPEMDTATWYAVFAPSTMPATMLVKLRGAYAAASSAPEWKAVMQKNELDPFKGNLDQFMVMVRKEAALLGADYKRLNLPQD